MCELDNHPSSAATLPATIMGVHIVIATTIISTITITVSLNIINDHNKSSSSSSSSSTIRNSFKQQKHSPCLMIENPFFSLSSPVTVTSSSLGTSIALISSSGDLMGGCLRCKIQGFGLIELRRAANPELNSLHKPQTPPPPEANAQTLTPMEAYKPQNPLPIRP